jgi:hypothetical protein
VINGGVIRPRCAQEASGEVTEWLKVHAWNACVL